MSIDAVPNYIPHLFDRRNSYCREMKKKTNGVIALFLMAVGCWLPSATMSSFTLKEHDFLSFTKFNRKFFALCVWWNLKELNFIVMAHTTLKLTKVAYLNSLRECSCARMQCHKERMVFSLILPIQSLFCTSNKYWMTKENEDGEKITPLIWYT